MVADQSRRDARQPGGRSVRSAVAVPVVDGPEPRLLRYVLGERLIAITAPRDEVEQLVDRCRDRCPRCRLRRVVVAWRLWCRQ